VTERLRERGVDAAASLRLLLLGAPGDASRLRQLGGRDAVAVTQVDQSPHWVFAQVRMPSE
jgi:hypothetical protein